VRVFEVFVRRVAVAVPSRVESRRASSKGVDLEASVLVRFNKNDSNNLRQLH